MDHGPETLQQHEARAAERQKTRKEERWRRTTAECIANYRLCCGHAQREIDAAQTLDDRGDDSFARWIRAAKDCSVAAEKALFIATLVPPSHWRTWTRRAANTAEAGSQCAALAASALRRQLTHRKGAPGLQVVSGGGEATSEAQRGTLRILGKGVN